MGYRSLKGFEWKLAPFAKIKTLSIVKKILFNRGFKTLPRRDEGVLSLASRLPNWEGAARLVAEAVRWGRPILLFGDYDVDGITSTTFMFQLLKGWGAKAVKVRVPERETGYGFSPAVAADIADRYPGALFIALDNGTKEVEAIKVLKQKGLDVVILDHHEPENTLPDAEVVNPKITPESGALRDLSTVGVVYLFAKLFEEFFGKTADPDRFLDLVALGTLADVSPLSEVNAFLVKRGLELINNGKFSRPALEKIFGILRTDRVSVKDLTFRVAPRLNAFGRMGFAKDGLKLLLTASDEVAALLVAKMEELNRERKSLTEQLLEEIEESGLLEPREKGFIYTVKPNGKRSIEGILGIVAGRLSSEYGLTTVILAESGNYLRGSARSPEGVNVIELLRRGERFLSRWGGHKNAAGLTLERRYFEGFSRTFFESLEGTEKRTPRLFIDAVAPPSEVKGTIGEIEKIGPFGPGNPEPVFVFRDRIVALRETRYSVKLRFKSGVELTFWEKKLASDLKRYQNVDVLIAFRYIGGSDPFEVADVAVPA